MAENRQGWRELLVTLDDHQKTFNDQLTRLKVEDTVPDPDSPLLGPVTQYSRSVSRLSRMFITKPAQYS